MEKDSYSTFRKHILSRGDRIDRVENPLVPGMFDVSCCLRPGVEFWLEMKNPIEPVRETTALFGSNHPVLLTQINWSKTQIQAGGLAFFFIDTNRRRLLVDARHADLINSWTVDKIREKALWQSNKPSPYNDWTILRIFFEGLVSSSERNLMLTK